MKQAHFLGGDGLFDPPDTLNTGKVMKHLKIKSKFTGIDIVGLPEKNCTMHFRA
jgi:hypothetical protein